MKGVSWSEFLQYARHVHSVWLFVYVNIHRWTQSSFETCDLPRSTTKKDLKSKERLQWKHLRVNVFVV